MMDIVKEYIVQSISVAANNLRLSSDKIESVAILRNYILNCDNLDEEITKMKTKTDLSKFAIKVGDLYSYIAKSNIDFHKITETFKEQSYNLIMELNILLDQVTPSSLSNILNESKNQEIKVNLANSNIKSEIPSRNEIEIIEAEKSKEVIERDELKEELIMNEVNDSEDFDFAEFEEKILKPIKSLESLLLRLNEQKYTDDEINEFLEIIKSNEELSRDTGFEILAEMHTIFYKGLLLMLEKRLDPDKQIIENMRACLIVIVAVVRGKDVDITNYLNRAEKFGKNITD